MGGHPLQLVRQLRCPRRGGTEHRSERTLTCVSEHRRIQRSHGRPADKQRTSGLRRGTQAACFAEDAPSPASPSDIRRNNWDLRDPRLPTTCGRPLSCYRLVTGNLTGIRPPPGAAAGGCARGLHRLQSVVWRRVEGGAALAGRLARRTWRKDRRADGRQPDNLERRRLEPPGL